jgi:hypothetical protein
MRKLKLTYKEVALHRKNQTYPKGMFDTLFGHPFMRGTFKKWSAHGLVPVVLGAAVVIVGPAAIQIRSAAVLICAFWLAIDIGIEVSEKNWNLGVKAIVFSALTCLCFCGAMGCMYWFLLSTLEDQRADAYQNIDGQVALPKSGYVMDSAFMVKNNSRQRIGPHYMECVIHRLTTYSLFVPKVDMRDGKVFVLGDSELPLEPGGDAQSETCLSRVFNPNSMSGAKCVDLTMKFVYVLESQGIFPQAKEYRFIAKQTESFVWHQQPLKMKVSPCDQMP